MASVKASPAGVQATHQYKASVKAFGPLLAQLRAGSVAGDVLAALWLIVGAMKGRDYLRAMDLYLKLSIGNAAWPIGVTQVGMLMPTLADETCKWFKELRGGRHHAGGLQSRPTFRHETGLASIPSN